MESNEPGKQVHIILEVTDTGTPLLIRYQGIVCNIQEPHQTMKLTNHGGRKTLTLSRMSVVMWLAMATAVDLCAQDSPFTIQRSEEGVEDLPDLAVRDGKWKLLCEFDGSNAELYNLDSDPGESTNLASQHPKMTGNLTTEVIEWSHNMQE